MRGFATINALNSLRYHLALAESIVASGRVVHGPRLIEWTRTEEGFERAHRFADAVRDRLIDNSGDILTMTAHKDYALAVPTPVHSFPLLCTFWLGIFLMLPSLACLAAGENYPVRPVRLVVPFAPGGGLDILARLLGYKFTDSMHQTTIIDNRTGAGGNIGAEIVAKAAPDGQTLLLTSTSLAVNASLYTKLSYDARRDFAPVSLIASVPLVLVVGPSAPARSLKDLVASIKAKPAAFTFASNGSGTTSHLSGELLSILTGAKLTHVPYKGGVPATTSVATSETNMLFTTIPSALPQIKSGRVTALAVSTKVPSTVLPGVPTVASVVPGFETDNWYGLFAPAATPRAIVERLHREVVQALKTPEVREALVREGSEPIGSTPAFFADYFANELTKYAKVVRASGATVN